MRAGRGGSRCGEGGRACCLLLHVAELAGEPGRARARCANQSRGKEEVWCRRQDSWKPRTGRSRGGHRHAFAPAGDAAEHEGEGPRERRLEGEVGRDRGEDGGEWGKRWDWRERRKRWETLERSDAGGPGPNPGGDEDGTDKNCAGGGAGGAVSSEEGPKWDPALNKLRAMIPFRTAGNTGMLLPQVTRTGNWRAPLLRDLIVRVVRAVKVLPDCWDAPRGSAADDKALATRRLPTGCANDDDPCRRRSHARARAEGPVGQEWEGPGRGSAAQAARPRQCRCCPRCKLHGWSSCSVRRACGKCGAERREFPPFCELPSRLTSLTLLEPAWPLTWARSATCARSHRTSQNAQGGVGSRHGGRGRLGGRERHVEGRTPTKCWTRNNVAPVRPLASPTRQRVSRQRHHAATGR